MCLREESEPHTYDSSGILAYFNPRFREGSDSVCDIFKTNVSDFNPRFREGSDISAFPVRAAWLHFNPRFREGSDGISDEDQKEIRISIHASAKEATLENSFCFAVVYISIHASAKEAT